MGHPTHPEKICEILDKSKLSFIHSTENSHFTFNANYTLRPKRLSTERQRIWHLHLGKRGKYFEFQWQGGRFYKMSKKTGSVKIKSIWEQVAKRTNKNFKIHSWQTPVTGQLKNCSTVTDLCLPFISPLSVPYFLESAQRVSVHIYFPSARKKVNSLGDKALSISPIPFVCRAVPTNCPLLRHITPACVCHRNS